MQKITLPQSPSLVDYQKVLGKKIIDQLKTAAKPLKGLKIVEINATSHGGGVAELLQSQIPLARTLGLDIDWYVLPPDERFFKTTKGLHNCLQGQCALNAVLDFAYYKKYLDSIAPKIPKADLYILHDPQTLGLVPHIKNKPIVWRCHIDLTEADETSFDWLQSYYPRFQKVIFSLEAYIHGLEHNKVAIVHPAIDPLSDKNKKLTRAEVRSGLESLKLPLDQPYMLQVSRFDKFKDPVGVIELYKKAKLQIPNLMCVLAGNYSVDDPEGFEYYMMTQAKSRQLAGNVKILTKANDVEINALQQAAGVVIQNSAREGFGLTVTEALWKQKIVFTHPVGGIALQVLDNKTGFYLSEYAQRNVEKIKQVIDDPAEFTKVVRAARTHVKNNFTLPVMLRDYFDVYTNSLKS